LAENIHSRFLAMLHAFAAVAVVFLAGTVSGRREHIQIHTGVKGWDIPGEEFEATIAKIWATFVKRAQIVRESSSFKGGGYTAAESMYNMFGKVEKFSEYTTAPCSQRGKVNKAGFDKMYDMASRWEKQVPDEIFKQGFNELYAHIKDANGCVDKTVTTNQLSARMMSAARIGVLKDAFELVTESVGTPMELGKMPCKDPEMQKWFFFCMHGDCEPANGNQITPEAVTFEEFKLYYNSLGMFIASDEQFELMVVNAWHMMGPRSWEKGGSYSEVNTVNVAMRCYEDTDDIEGKGTYVVLKSDCPSPRGHRDIATAKAKAQEKKAFAKGCYFHN